MKKITALVFCSALILVSGGDVTDKNPIQADPKLPPNTPEPLIPIQAKTTTSTEKTTTTTEKTTTSTEKTTTSTIPSTTSTSTTPSTTTSTQAPATSTIPVPTTNAPITTTPPVPEPSTKKWVINNTDTFIIAKMAVQVEVMYNNTKNQQLSKKFDIPTDNRTSVSAQFSPFNESMNLSWKSVGNSINSLELHFTKSSDNKTYVLSGLKVTIAPEELPDFASNSSLVLVDTTKYFNTSVGNSYRCVKLMKFHLASENNSTVGQLKVSDLQFQAFKTEKNPSFGFAEDCAFDTPDVVPIAVGCVLAGLVVIVLGAYLINRKRSQARGYFSM